MTSGAAGEALPPLNYRLERTLEGHAGSVASVKFSPDGQWCVLVGDSTQRALEACTAHGTV